MPKDKLLSGNVVPQGGAMSAICTTATLCSKTEHTLLILCKQMLSMDMHEE